MSIIQQPTGRFIDEKEIVSFKLVNSKGNFVEIFNYGTIINKFVVKDKNGVMRDIVLGFDQIDGYLSDTYLSNYPYLGAIIGRYANRIKDAYFELEGVGYQLPQNAGGSCLHGGNSGFDRKVWDAIEIVESPNPKVTFQYFSLDGEEGFPGDLAVQLSFEFTSNDELILNYQADTDEATPVNLTHHSYFNLSENGGSVANHIQQINASNYLEQDETWSVTGTLIPVENTLHDFRKPKAIGFNWDQENGYDQTYVLDKNYGELSLATKTSSPDTGLSLLVYTTEPVAHLYTSKYLNVDQAKGGKSYGEFDAFCVETQHHPNAVNIPSFPSTILMPEEVYHQTTIYKVTVD